MRKVGDAIALNKEASSPERHRQSVVALIAIGAWDEALKLAGGIHDARNKADVLNSAAESLTKLNDPDKAAVLLDRLRRLIPCITNSSWRDTTWVILSGQAAHLGNWSQARKFADELGSESARIDALSRILETWGAS